jgi:hypothetical protein
MMTALLAIGSFMVQAKVSKDENRTQHDIERSLEAHEKSRELAALQLERVRTQMMDVYRPLSAAYCASLYTTQWMARELDFEWLRLNGFDSCFIRPSEQLYPHLEVRTQDFAPEHIAHVLEAQGATMWHKWSPGDLQVRRGAPSGLARLQLCSHSPNILLLLVTPPPPKLAAMIVRPFMTSLRVRSHQLLADDPTKRAIYTDAHTCGMVPRWRDMAAISTTKTALIEPPPPESLAALGSWAAAMDWAKIYNNTLIGSPFRHGDLRGRLGGDRAAVGQRGLLGTRGLGWQSWHTVPLLHARIISRPRR